MRLRTLVIPTLLLFLVAAALPASAATQAPGFGQVISAPVGTDGRSTIVAGGPSIFGFVDTDGSGTLTGSEPVYLAVSTTLASTDVRLADTTAGAPGTRVSGSEIGTTIIQLSGSLGYVDADGTGSLSTDDVVYYDVGSSNTVTLGDVILTGANAGTVVRGGAQYVGVPLTALSATLGYHDANTNSNFDATERMVLDTNQDGYVTVLDVRLGAGAPGGFGSYVVLEDSDVTYRLRSDVAPTQLIFWDKDSDGTPDGNEEVVLSRDSQLSVFSIRLGAPEVGQAGSMIKEGDFDFGQTGTGFSATISYLDSNNNDVLDPGETAYLDKSDGNTGKVSIGDVILSGANAGNLVVGGSANVGTSLKALPGTYAILDGDGNGVLSSRDIVYRDVDGDGFANAGDLQLSITPGAPAPPPGSDPASLTVTAPTATTEVEVNGTLAITGTADPGTTSGSPNTVSSLTVTVGGTSVPVTGTTSFNATYVPTATGPLDVVVTLTPSSGTPVSKTITVTVVAEGSQTDGGATKTCPDGTTVAADANCPGVDEQAREDAQEAKELAEEARDAAQRAEETADAAKQAAEGARGAAENNQETLQQIVDKLNEDGEDEAGVPGPGPALTLAALATALAVANRRRQR